MEASSGETSLSSSAATAAESVEATSGNKSLDNFRQWIDSQPNITWLKDDDFLGAFARLSTENDSEAQNRLQRLLTSQKKHPQWFENIDTTEPKIQEVLDAGALMLLPELDDNGKQFYIARVAGLKLKKIDSVSWMRSLVVFFNYQFLIDYKGKTGTAAIVDFGEATYESFEAVMPLDVLSEWLPILVSHYPGRVTDLRYINCHGNIREKIVEANKRASPAKATAGTKVHFQTLEELYKDVPMRCLPVEYLPADYTGPNAGTVQQVIEYTKSTLTKPETRDRIALISHNKWSIDNSQQKSAAGMP